MVLGLPPVLNDDTCFLHRRKLFTVQAIIAEAAVETLNKAVLPRTARFDVGRPHLDRLQELTDAPRDKLWSIVASKELWNASDRK